MPWPHLVDDEIERLTAAEIERQNTALQLIASENFASPAVMAATGSVFTNKYSEGYPGKRYYGGNQVVDQVEDLARQRVCELFGADHANVQPHSGANANMAVYQALLEPGDTVLGLRLDHGGHLTHGSPVNASGLTYNFVSYGLTPSDERIDIDQVAELARTHRPKLIVTGATAYPRVIDAKPFRDIADEVGARLMFDAAHIAGLIVGGVHPNPVDVADIVTFTTHKTMRGPRGGCILSTAELAAAVDKAVFPGQQGGPLEHAIAAKAGARRRRDHAQPQRHPRRSPLALRHLRSADRHPGRHHPGDDRGPHGRDRRADRRDAAPPERRRRRGLGAGAGPGAVRPVRPLPPGLRCALRAPRVRLRRTPARSIRVPGDVTAWTGPERVPS